MRGALLDVERPTEAACDVGEIAGSFGLRRADLEVRVSRAAQRSRAEQGTAEVGRRATAAGYDALWRPVERAVRAVEDAGSVQGRVGGVGTFHVELVARRLVERPARVGAD